MAGSPESPVDPTPRTKGGSPHRDPVVWKRDPYTDLLGVVKMHACTCVYACVYAQSVGEFGFARPIR